MRAYQCGWSMTCHIHDLLVTLLPLRILQTGRAQYTIAYMAKSFYAKLWHQYWSAPVSDFLHKF